MVTVAEVVARRDERQAQQRALLEERHMSLVSFTVVAPGPEKSNDLIHAIYQQGEEEILALLRDIELWPIWDIERYDGPTGPELLLSVDAAPADIKTSLVQLEEAHPWGRLWDIDVVTGAGPVARTELGFAQRTCLICDKPSPECARSRAHSVEELVAQMHAIVAAYPIED